ncbi:MAG: hypothetical protein J7L39_02145, partial [Candidatus Aenigmarchaeota archaeon]|nr:hypothetical protein [Candidatus Aenigmarchaeota archaeon]
YKGNEIPVYVTEDGKYMFLSSPLDMGQNLQRAQTQTQTSTPEIPKSDVPDVKLFVMSYCPFGIQAEKALIPVLDLLGNKINYRIHFVYYIMHGKKELDENLRQYCIQETQKEKFKDYLYCFVQSGDYDKCLDEAGIDRNALKACMETTDQQYKIYENYNDQSTWYNGRFQRWDVELELNQNYGVRGSPTIVINNVRLASSRRYCSIDDEKSGKCIIYPLDRSPESFKQAICSAFNNPPEECNQQLSTQTMPYGIGPLTGGSATSGGSCG